MRLSAVGTIVVALLVASCGENVTLPQPAADSTGENVALLQNAKTGDTLAINRSLAAGADPNYVPSGGVSEAYHLSEFGETPLINAARGGQLPAVRLLLQRGARPNVRTYDDTPLHAAAIRGHVDIVKLLLEWGANVNARVGIGTGEDALRGALVRGQANAVAVLYAEGAAIEPSYLCDAVSDGKEGMVSLFLSIGLDPKSIDCRGRSAFDIARTLTTSDREKILRRLAAGAWPHIKPPRWWSVSLGRPPSRPASTESSELRVPITISRHKASALCNSESSDLESWNHGLAVASRRLTSDPKSLTGPRRSSPAGLSQG